MRGDGSGRRFSSRDIRVQVIRPLTRTGLPPAGLLREVSGRYIAILLTQAWPGAL
jgi:hypothetical protein